MFHTFAAGDDKGKTWSKRYRLPKRVTAADRNNFPLPAAKPIVSSGKRHF
jgi:hypothetical protein